jgi:hypothetical protein
MSIIFCKVQENRLSFTYWSREFQYIKRENQMSYGVQITVEYTETTSTGTIKNTRTYSMHVDTASDASSVITETAKNAKGMNATVEKVEVTEENQNSYENPYRNLSDKEILDLILTK